MRVPSSFGEARGCDPWQSTRSDSLQDESGNVDFSEADRDAMEAREDIRSMSRGIYLSPPRHIWRTNVCTDRVVIPNSVDVH